MLSFVELIDFRNYKHKKLDLNNGVNVLYGINGAGKTNILEALFLVATGESFRAEVIDDMVRFDQEFGQVRVGIQKNDEDILMEIIVSGGVIMGKRTTKKKFLVNKAPRRKIDFVGYQKMVLFRPEDVEMISGQPSGRRRFVDQILCQISRQYAESLASYEAVIKKRNRSLVQIREGQSNVASLAFWDGMIVRYASLLQEKRAELISYINDLWSRSEMFAELGIDYKKSIVTEKTLAEKQSLDIVLGYTSVGAHKDDWSVVKFGKSLDNFGSRGEQRMAVLALKMGELYYVEHVSKEKIVLLLDDVFSELDDSHKTEVLRLMQGRQVVATTANREDVALLGEDGVFSV
jgi:DNA replication and repair protein RecF